MAQRRDDASGSRLILSDLHFGHSRSHSLGMVLELLTNPYERVYLLGDIVDPGESGFELLANLVRPLRERIYDEPNRYAIIPGNHDPLKLLRDLFPPETIVANGVLFEQFGNSLYILLHGHQFDYGLIFYTTIIRPIERLFTGSMGRWWDTMIHRYYAYRVIGPVERRAAWRARQNEHVNGIIMGHTHAPKIIFTPRIKYLNPGAFLGAPPDNSVIEWDGTNFNLLWT
jgi:UDP-2,3-diacylglucosamine pyrophosphatase LpxH